MTTIRQFIAILGISSAVLLVSPPSGGAAGAKPKPEDIVAANLASIGTPEARAAARSRQVDGTAQITARRGAAMAMTGTGMLLSEGRNIHLGMSFSSPDYPGDQIAYDSKTLTTAQIRPGLRSFLSDFLYQCDTPVREGLLGGTLSVAWALSEVPGRQPRLEYSGLKKINGRQLHELKYKPKQSACGVAISLYFEPETFRHVRSQYRLTKPPVAPTNFQNPTSQGDTVYTLTEDFGDFKTVDGLTLPHDYKLDMTIEGPTSTYLASWTLSVSRISHNQSIDPKEFSVR